MDFKNLVKAYKLFRTKQGDPETLYPLFVNANKPVPMGEWVQAEVGPLAQSGKVKSKLGELAYRPGWHAGDVPVATHIGAKSQPGLRAPDVRPPEQVWAEVDMPADIDWQAIANQRALVNQRGEIIPRTAHITDEIPFGGHYRYKTSPNMQGNWLISGDMRVNRVLSDEEVRAINEAYGMYDLPRYSPLKKKAEGGLAQMAGGSAVAKAAKEAFKNKFTHGFYHGTGSRDIEQFAPGPRGATFVTRQPRFAESFLPIDEKASEVAKDMVYAPGATMYPLSVNLGKHFDYADPAAQKLIEAYAKEANATPEVIEGLKTGAWDLMEDPRFMNFLKKHKYDTFAVREMGTKNIGVFDPKNIRGRFAEFDPAQAESADFMKAEGGLAKMARGGKTPAWQRKEGQNPEGGLNAKGRASYKAETGGELKRPQPEGGPRRDSFCARMKGMKKKLTSAKTANDPDSRINKSLRAWNC